MCSILPGIASLLIWQMNLTNCVKTPHKKRLILWNSFKCLSNSSFHRNRIKIIESLIEFAKDFNCLYIICVTVIQMCYQKGNYVRVGVWGCWISHPAFGHWPAPLRRCERCARASEDLLAQRAFKRVKLQLVRQHWPEIRSNVNHST